VGNKYTEWDNHTVGDKNIRRAIHTVEQKLTMEDKHTEG
jgi:hypothetical protein